MPETDDTDDVTLPVELDTSDLDVLIGMLTRALTHPDSSVSVWDVVKDYSAPPPPDVLYSSYGTYDVRLGEDARATMRALKDAYKAKQARDRKAKKNRRLKRAEWALRTLERCGPDYASFETHRYEALDSHVGETVYQSYVETATANAWRMWWFYGPGPRVITVFGIGPHPKRSISTLGSLSG